jgi:hypothetical protein
MTAGDGEVVPTAVAATEPRGWRQVVLIVATVLVGLQVGQLAIGGVLLSLYGLIHGVVTDPSPALLIWPLVALASLAPAISGYVTWRSTRARHTSTARSWTLSLCAASFAYLLAVCVVVAFAFALPL